MDNADNMLKYGNYKEQMGRLKKAMANHFLLEAICIEYNVIEDRTESILRHAGVFNPEKHGTLAKKIRRIKEIARGKRFLLRRYLSEDQMEEIRLWSKRRNDCIHDLLNQPISTQELALIAEEGQRLAKLLCSKVTSYNRALERERQKNENGGEVR